MRKRFEIQYELGATPIEKLEIPLKSRDEMPPVLRALQFIYITPELNKQVFDILEEKVMAGKKRTGRFGLSLWEILVFASIRLTRDVDYDQLHYMATTDVLFRGLLGANRFGETQRHYGLQTIKDNVSLVDEQTINRINELVVKAGHQIIKKNEDAAVELNVNIDSYVLESTVHFPTDLNLLLDAARKCLGLAKKICKGTNIKGFRKAKYWLRRLKSCCRSVGKLSASPAKNKEKRLHEAAREYLEQAEVLQAKLKNALPQFEAVADGNRKKTGYLTELKQFSLYLEKHIDLVNRRVLLGETIPHDEKMFSLFEEYTQWIKKGKAGGRPELGVPIAVAKDQYGFILMHRVMEDEHDKDVAVPMAEALIKNYKIKSLSFDKNFWTRDNHETLSPQVSVLVMPKKGKLNQEEYEREHKKTFITLRHKHSAVESGINALEHHGLNRCPDKGRDHFKCYAALGVLAYNLHILGNLLLAKDRQARREACPRASTGNNSSRPYKRAA